MMQDLYTNGNNFVDYLKRNNLRINPSIGDGHCFLYSLANGLRDQLNASFNLNTIKSSILSEISIHFDRYKHYLTQDRDHILDIKNYINHKCYNTPICDFLPYIVSNSLDINILIIDQLNDGTNFNTLIKSVSNVTTTVLLHKIRDHYNAIQFTASPQNDIRPTGHHRQLTRPVDPQTTSPNAISQGLASSIKLSSLCQQTRPVGTHTLQASRTPSANNNIFTRTIRSSSHGQQTRPVGTHTSGPTRTTPVMPAAEEHTNTCTRSTFSGSHGQQTRPVGTRATPTKTPATCANGLTYTADQLRKLNSTQYKINRSVRKTIFSNNIWRPRCHINYFDTISGTCKTNLIECSVTNLENQQTGQSKKCNKLKFGLVNARSINNKVEEIIDTIITNDIDVLAITESWLADTSTPSPAIVQILKGLHNFNFNSQPRPDKRGGGICVLFKDSLTVTKNPIPAFESFELLDLTIKFNQDLIRLATVYRPPNAGKTASPTNFLSEFSTYLELVLVTNNRLLVTGDFNIHVDNKKCLFAKNFSDIISSSGLQQHVNKQTHQSGHTLDLIISRTEDTDFVSDLNISATGFSDHSLVKLNLNLNKPSEKLNTVSCRHLKKINLTDFKNDITQSAINKLASNTCTDHVKCFNQVLGDILEKHAPIRT